jgi:hypothetical protein
MQYLARSAVAAAAAMTSSLSYTQPVHLEMVSSVDLQMNSGRTELIERPTLPVEFARNFKFIFDHDLLLTNDFFSKDNLKNLFNLRTVEITKDDESIFVLSSDFSGIFPRERAPEFFGGSVASASFVGGKVSRNSELVSAELNFRIESGGPSFQVAEHIFGSALVLVPPMPFAHGSAPPATDPHGNEDWKYETALGRLEKSIVLGFNPAGHFLP